MNDSYTSARIHVMRTKLIQPADYEKLLKMGDKEIINYLQSTEYKKEVDSLEIKDLEDLEVIDKILALNRERTVAKLSRISSKNFKKVLGRVLRENDAWNLKVIAEAIKGRADPKEAIRLYARKGTLDPVIFAGAKSIEELSRLATKLFPALEQKPETLLEFTDILLKPDKKMEPTKTDRYLIDEKNILTIIRCKRDNLSPEKITSLMQKGGIIYRSLLQKAAAAKDLNESLQVLRTTTYKNLIDKALDELDKGTLVRFEYELHKEMLKLINTRTRARPLGPDVLVHYITSKDIEHENLRLLIKGKRLGLDEKFIREYMIA